MTHTQAPSAGAAGAAALAVTDDMTVYSARARKEELLSALAASTELELDLSAVTAIDVAGVQLLILLKREAAAQGKTLRFSNHSPAVVETIDFCNLAGPFGDPMLIAAHSAG
ncbi:STAS domain-containing protein [Aromatoleum buckelii]|uniref:STAS domain-containing protein n=1 Tax=Aromatoleum buckelii TaxID=200254 RepID=A0ABX1N5Y4_9RHOO|nr:STAS domain-containing protein [Aromatoleum buckelii]MCK0509619.1 STAS domain-containing protein [Aromatoleum buckelii]